MQLLRAANNALPAIYKAHKWIITRGDLDYTALWILYAATPLAHIEVVGAGLLADREVIPQAMKLNPVFQDRIYRFAQREEDRKAVQTALDAGDATWRSVLMLFRAIDRTPARGRRSAFGTEIENHFNRQNDVERDDHGVRIFGGSGNLRQGLNVGAFTKRSNVEVQELAFFYFAGPPDEF